MKNFKEFCDCLKEYEHTLCDYNSNNQNLRWTSLIY